MITLYTIGFTKKTAEQFFTLLSNAKVKKLVDIRLNNKSQLAGFAKGTDLPFFMKKICNAGYEHIVDLAPTGELLSDYQKGVIDWQGYEKVFRKLLDSRHILNKYNVAHFDGACFLCTEHTPEHCHRRLVAEYFKQGNPSEEISIIHLY